MWTQQHQSTLSQSSAVADMDNVYVFVGPIRFIASPYSITNFGHMCDESINHWRFVFIRRRTAPNGNTLLILNYNGFATIWTEAHCSDVGWLKISTDRSERKWETKKKLANTQRLNTNKVRLNHRYEWHFVFIHCFLWCRGGVSRMLAPVMPSPQPK